MRARRQILSVPVSEELDTRVRLAARAQGVTVAAWVREQLLTSVRHPAAPSRPLSKDAERRIWQLMQPPMFYTTDYASLLGLSPPAMRRALRMGDLVGHLTHRTFFDPGRRKWLRRRWWRVPADAMWAYVARCNEYRQGHGCRPYTPRPATTAARDAARGDAAT